MLSIGAFAVLAALGVRAGYIATVKADDLSGMADRQHEVTVEIPAPRGAIISADGRELAVDTHATAVSATPYLIRDKHGTAERIATAVGLPVAEVERRISVKGGYASLSRGVDQQRARYLRTLNIPGIDLTDAQKRLYPLGTVAAQLVGMTDDYGVGIAGFEKNMNTQLTGTAGRRQEARDPFGRALRILDDAEPTPGRTVTLTLDSAIQQKTEAVLQKVLEDNNAKAVSAIVMRPSDGAVLALATVPGYDPNSRATFNPDAERARSITDAYEPGATFKLVTVAGALEEGLVTPQTVFDLPGTLTLYDRTLKEAHPRPAVSWDVQKILQDSSNIGTVKIGMLLGPTRIQHWIQRFGFGAKTGIDFPGEVSGLTMPADQWSGTSILNIPIGQGVAVTLAQMAEAYGAIANDGVMVPPHLVKRIGAKAPPHPRGQRIVSVRTSSQLNTMLQKVVSDDGTGALARVPGYTVAGKTGTSNKIDPKTGRYTESYVASFIGFAPATHPALVVAVMVDEPRAGSYYGGQVAAPAFEQITQFALQHLHIAP